MYRKEKEKLRKFSVLVCIRNFLVISSSYHIVREASTHRHAFLLINQQRILFHFNVLFKPLLVPKEVRKSLICFCKFVFQKFYTLGYFCHFFKQFIVGLVIAGFNFWSSGSLFEPCLGYSKRGVLSCNIAFQTLNVAFLFSYFLKFVHIF